MRQTICPYVKFYNSLPFLRFEFCGNKLYLVEWLCLSEGFDPIMRTLEIATRNIPYCTCLRSSSYLVKGRYCLILPCKLTWSISRRYFNSILAVPLSPYWVLNRSTCTQSILETLVGGSAALRCLLKGGIVKTDTIKGLCSCIKRVSSGTFDLRQLVLWYLILVTASMDYQGTSLRI